MVIDAIRARVRAARESGRQRRRLHSANPALALMERRSWLLLFLLLLGMFLHGSAHADKEVVTWYQTDEQSNVIGTRHEEDLALDVGYNPYGEGNFATQLGGPGYGGHLYDDHINGMIYMQGRYYYSHTARFLSVDPVVGAPGDVHDFNRYAYGRNNPYRYVDPDGRQTVPLSTYTIDWTNAQTRSDFVDAAAAIVPGADLAVCAINGCAGTDWAVAAASSVPFAKPVRLGAAVVDSVQTARKMTAVAQKGKIGEAAVRAKYDIGRSERIDINGRTRIPDGLRRGESVSEVKNVKYQAMTRQLRDNVDYTGAKGMVNNLYLNEGARTSRSLEEAAERGDVTIIRYTID